MEKKQMTQKEHSVQPKVRRQQEIKRLEKEIRQLRKQWRKATDEGRKALKALQEEVKLSMVTLQRAEFLRKQLKKERVRTGFYRVCQKPVC